MTVAPFYFETIRCRASRRWDQLERDPELAGPWHQLFKQVQSPRHVVSELLQNADDAGATKAWVDIEDGDFVFRHDGEDFTEDHFASLCRFGYSNKRDLHTIGFRGVGFKSTFSIGDKVCLKTPSLSVLFCRERFTEPVWQMRNGMPENCTEIRVVIKDDYRHRELKKNLEDWTKSPASLLFFRTLRCLSVQGQEIRWEAQSPGPVVNSRWMALSNDPSRRYLLIQSRPEKFPGDALKEIQQERMVTIDEKTTFPPCDIEVVLGFEGRLFVILPTGVKTDLPFACNAPFIQDPARVKIKDPDTSPTNRWLLERVGRLAAETMLEWLGQTEWGVRQRCEAYALLPELNREDHSIEDSCGRIVMEACESALRGQAYLITENGLLVKKRRCISVPEALLDIWTLVQVQRFFSEEGLPILSRYISAVNRLKLANWDCFKEIDKEYILEVLISKELPKPATWDKLLNLWIYFADEITDYTYPHYNYHNKNEKARIVPVQGKDVLFSAAEVVRLGEKKLLNSKEDWEFLDDYLLVLNQNWPRYLSEQKRKAKQKRNFGLQKNVNAAYKILDSIGLNETSDTNQIIQQVVEKIFNENRCTVEDCIRLAQLAATLGASVSDDFQFVTRDGCRRSVRDSIVYDVRNDLDGFISNQWYQKHVLHEGYRSLLCCTKEEWQRWVVSGRSGLLTFIPLIKTQQQEWWQGNILEFLHERGFNGEPSFPYKRDNFTIEDWDFDEKIWQFWQESAGKNKEFWGRLFTFILAQSKDYWVKSLFAKVWQNAIRYKQSVVNEDLPASWIVKFSALPCLQDTRGYYRQPEDLLCRTPDTEALLDVEPFVRAELDTEANRQLLIMLGVRNTPSGPDKLLGRLQSLSTVENPPVYEVEKWCNRLDQIINKCSSDEFKQIKDAFFYDKLILTAESEWALTTEVFLNADEEDVPGAAIVHPAIRNLSIWHKIGVAERPTAKLSLKWLASIESNKKLSQDELRRVRALLPRFSERIWLECRHWLNLDGEWAPVEQLTYKLTMQTLIPWSNLFRSIKQKTADLQKLNSEICGQYPFTELPTLADSIEDRLEKEIVDLKGTLSKPWLATLGNGLARVIVDDDTESRKVQYLGGRLSNTQWRVVTTLKTTPYINRTPSGTPRSVDVLWKDTTFYVKSESVGKMAKAIAQELGRAFGRSDIADAIKLCFERDQAFVNDYLQENFRLLPIQEPSVDDALEKNPNDTDGLSGETDDSSPIVSDPRDTENGTGQNTDHATPNPEENGSRDNDPLSCQEELQPDEEGAFDDDHEPRRQPPRSTKPKLIERYANAHGFTKNNIEGRYYHKDGSWLERVSGNSFPWEQYSGSGELMQCYWTKEHCIEREPLQLEADVWELCVKYPDKYTLILTDFNDNPAGYNGWVIRRMLEAGQLILHPAKYRVEYDHNKEADIYG